MKKSSALLAGILCLAGAGSSSAAPDPDPTKALARLAKDRLEAARKTYLVAWKNYRQRHASADFLYLWSVRWLEAEKLVKPQPAEQLVALKGHLERMRQLERLIVELQRAGQATVDEISAAEFYRSEAELWLLQAKVKYKLP
jgi:hypothetical protein